MDAFNSDLNKVLKYQRERLPVSAIHPELRFTRLGAILREHATEPNDVGELAYQALTSDHSQPLELMPLHLLRDKMLEEPDHPLAGKFKWDTLPEKVQLDNAVRSMGQWAEPFLFEHNKRKWGDAAIDKDPNVILSSQFGWASPKDLDHSAKRVRQQRDFSQLVSSWEEHQIPDYIEQVHSHLLPTLKTPHDRYE